MRAARPAVPAAVSGTGPKPAVLAHQRCPPFDAAGRPRVTDRKAEGTHAAELPYFYLERYTASYVHEWEAFVAALVAGERPPVTTADARAPLVIGLVAWRSLREARPVRIDEVAA